jgi:DnaA family protein
MRAGDDAALDARQGRQLALDLPPVEPLWSLSNFVALGCPDLPLHLRRLLEQPLAPPAGALYWHGVAATGKTHLLRAAEAELRARGRPAPWWLRGGAPAEEAPAEFGAVLIDDAERLDDAVQRLAFVAYEQAIAHGLPVFAAGALPPRELPLRDDLKTRLAWGHAYALEPLDDDGRRLALRAHAMARGFDLAPELAHWILAHWPRDMASMVRLLERLDRYSFNAKKAVSLPLLKAMLQQDLLA